MGKTISQMVELKKLIISQIALNPQKGEYQITTSEVKKILRAYTALFLIEFGTK